MNIITSFFRWLGGNANTQRQGSQVTSPSTTAHEDVQTIGVDSALQVSTVWACVTLLTETVSSLPLCVYRADETGSRQPVISGRLHQVLCVSPNPRQTVQEFWEQMCLNYFFRGNAFARIARAGDGEVTGLWPLSADQVEVIVTPDDEIFYKYHINGQQLIFVEADILHIRGMGNGVVGMSPLDYMRASIGLAVNAQNHTNNIYRKNSRRPGILMSDTVLTDPQRERLRENFGDIASGGQKELYILEAQFKFEPLGMAPADIQLLESRQFSVQDIARWFGVPSVLVNDTKETTSLGSSVAEIISGFHRLKLRPQLERIEQAIIKRVLSPRQRAARLTVEFNLDALLRASLKDRMEIYAKGVQNGIFNRNEPRRKEGMPAYDAGEIFTAQSNLVPVDKLGILKPTSQSPTEPIEQ